MDRRTLGANLHLLMPSAIWKVYMSILSFVLWDSVKKRLTVMACAMQCVALTRNTYGNRGKRQGQIPKVLQAINYAAYQALRYIRPESEPYLVEKFAQLTAAGYPGLDPALVGTKTNGNTPPVRISHPVSSSLVQKNMERDPVLSQFCVRTTDFCLRIRPPECSRPSETLYKEHFHSFAAG